MSVRRVYLGASFFVALAGAGLASCSAGSGGGGDRPGGSKVGSPGGSTSTGGSLGIGGSTSVGGTGPGGTGGTFTNLDSGSTGGVPEGGECSAVTQQAENKPAPVDVIWAVDNSDSMVNELAAVEGHLNNFYNVVNSGVDMHVVMLGQRGRPNDGSLFNPDPGYCISPPLGSGGCPGADSNPPIFMHVDVSVGSNTPLNRLIDNYQTYKPILRKNALKYFAVVTDDNSGMSASAFTNAVNSLDPGWFDQWKFFGVFCTGSCGVFLACAATGSVYTQLTQQTGTTPGDLCGAQQDFGPVFNQLAQTILTGTKLSCEWDIPPPPPPETLNPGKVNVDYTPTGGTPQPIFKVQNVADCGPQGGWYYDDDVNPTKIFVCPTTCNLISADLTGRIDIKFGCDTIPVPK